MARHRPLAVSAPSWRTAVMAVAVWRSTFGHCVNFGIIPSTALRHNAIRSVCTLHNRFLRYRFVFAVVAITTLLKLVEGQNIGKPSLGTLGGSSMASGASVASPLGTFAGSGTLGSGSGFGGILGAGDGASGGGGSKRVFKGGVGLGGILGGGGGGVGLGGSLGGGGGHRRGDRTREAIGGGGGESSASLAGGNSNDVSDLIYGGKKPLAISAAAGTVAVDPDEDRRLDPAQRRERMRACDKATRNHMRRDPTEMDAKVAAVLAQSQGPSATKRSSSEEMTTEQALSYIVFSMVLSCYYEIEDVQVDQINRGKHVSRKEEKGLFQLSESPPRPTRQQFILLESVLKEEQERSSKEAIAMGDIPGGLGIIGSGMGPRTKLAYVSAVGILLVVGGFWSYRRMSQERPPRQRTQRALQKVMKGGMIHNNKKSR